MNRDDASELLYLQDLHSTVTCALTVLKSLECYKYESPRLEEAKRLLIEEMNELQDEMCQQMDKI